ncbi:hypothetical protein VDG1235_1540 [Verrucomicrobiia bacterium DG1235]|nr:hypothetical protein VDG1235_1540 [Verrucomicrobiae bacterium DG1235]
MKTKLLSPAFIPALAALFAFAVTAQAADEVQTFELDGINQLKFSIAKSNVSIIGTDRSDIQLTLEKPFTGFDPEKVTQSVDRVGDTLVIEIEYEKSGKGWFWSSDNKGYSAANLIVPNELVASIRTSGGNVTAEAINAPLTLNTSGGNIRAADISGRLDIKTSGGNIQLRHITGDTDAHTSGGNISVEGLAGAASVHTSGGNINIEGQISSLKAHTSGGHINAHLQSQLIEPLVLKTSGGNVSATLDQGMTAPAELSTSGGSVSINLPRDQSFKIYAKSSGGHVSLDHGGSFNGSLSNKKIEGTVNGDGPLVKLSTHGGRVRISEI